jgi:hypothetical protein
LSERVSSSNLPHERARLFNRAPSSERSTLAGLAPGHWHEPCEAGERMNPANPYDPRLPQRDSPLDATASAVFTLNALLRAELGAIATYVVALRKIDVGHDPSQRLATIAVDHRDNARLLGREVGELGGAASTDVANWSEHLQAVQSSAAVLTDPAALLALHAGELRILEDYRAALDNFDLLTSSRALIARQLIPKQERHLSTLAALLTRLRGDG